MSMSSPRSWLPVAALLSCGLSSPSAAALRASYEVALSANGSSYSTRSAETLHGQAPIRQELGRFQVELLPEVGTSGDYVLVVTVTATPSSPSAITSSASLRFPGALGGPLEFSGQFGEAQVSGAIMLREIPD